MMDAFKTFFNWVGVFFVAYMIGYASFLFLSVLVGSSTLYQVKRRNFLKNELHQNYYVPVSIVVPAYNEEVTIVSTVRSLLSLDYKLYEIIVVDDGSRDNTAQTLLDAFRMRQVTRPIHRMIACQPELAVYESLDEKVPITLICKKNGGKADALNMGINASKYPYFVCMDADSVLQYDSLEKIVRPVVEDGSVVAVGGAVRPCNGAKLENGRVLSYRMPDKVLPCMQVLEYDRSFLAASSPASNRDRLPSLPGAACLTGRASRGASAPACVRARGSSAAAARARRPFSRRSRSQVSLS